MPSLDRFWPLPTSLHRRHAIERAALASLETAMPLHLLHVANLAPLERLRQIMAATSDDMHQQVLDAARTRLDDLSSALQKRFGVSPEREVVAGELLAALSLVFPAAPSHDGRLT